MIHQLHACSAYVETQNRLHPKRNLPDFFPKFFIEPRKLDVITAQLKYNPVGLERILLNEFCDKFELEIPTTQIKARVYAKICESLNYMGSFYSIGRQNSGKFKVDINSLFEEKCIDKEIFDVFYSSKDCKLAGKSFFSEDSPCYQLNLALLLPESAPKKAS